MNTFVLMIILNTGLVEGAHFASMNECLAVQRSLRSEAFCVERKPKNIEAELNKMLTILRSMKTQMESF